jgi:poly(A) polymerase
MKNLSKMIHNAAPRAYYVGGVLRDGILKRYCGDIDLALPRERVKPAAIKLAKYLNGAAFEMDAYFCIWRVTSKRGLQIDLSAFAGEDIKEDLKRRDFTINALAYPVSAMPAIKIRVSGKKSEVLLTGIKKDVLIDLSKGLEDLKAKTIRASNKNVFKEDPLRLLRAFRAAAELKFKIAPATLTLIKKDAALASKPAGERVQEEFKRMFRCLGTRQKLFEMDKAGVLTALFPVLENQKKCAGIYYGKGGVFTHTLDVVDRMEYLLRRLKKAFPKYYRKLLPYVNDAALYKMAALLHDIAKPETAKMMQGRLRFFYHEEKGAEMAQDILKNLKYGTADIRMISKMIKYHLRPSNLASNEIITDKGAYKFFKELGEAGVPMLLMCWADYTSYVTPAQLNHLIKKTSEPVITIEEGREKGSVGKTLRHMQVLNFLFNKYFNESKKIILPQRLIDGKDIMQTLGIAPGPRVGQILEAVTLAQVESKIKTRRDALDYIRKEVEA